MSQQATEAIPAEQVAFDPHSFRDPAGRVFEWRGELYRGVRTSFLPILDELIETGALARIVDRGLMVGTEVTRYALDGYSRVVHHQRVPVVSYPTEWSPAMLRDAARLTLDLVAELANDGMAIADPHPWNVLFAGPRPVFVDLTSISRSGPRWAESGAFRRHSLHPLVLMANGHDEWARWVMTTDRGVWARDMLGLAPRQALALGIDQALDRWSRVESTIARLRDRVDSVSVPKAASSREMSRELVAAIDRCLSASQPSSVLMIDEHDASCIAGVAKRCDRLVVIDRDPIASSGLHVHAVAEGLDVLPLVMDFALPTPAHGLFGSLSVSGLDRFRSHAVIATRVVSYLESAQRRLGCKQALRGLAKYAERQLVLVYEPPSAESPVVVDQHEFATLERFVATARSCFDRVESIPVGDGARALLVCRNE